MNNTRRNHSYRVMVMQETGEELCVEDNILGRERAEAILDETMAQHEEWRGWIELEQDWRSYR